MRQVNISNTVPLQAQLDEAVHFVKAFDTLNAVAISSKFSQVAEAF